jgi:acetate kinase
MARLETQRPRDTLVIALILNSGSSSLKFHLANLKSKIIIAHGLADWAGEHCKYNLHSQSVNVESTLSVSDPASCFHHLLNDLQSRFQIEMNQLTVIGHRVVHGGNLAKATLLNTNTLEEITHASTFAPLHNPPAIKLINEAINLLPNIKQVACFDTAFHSTMPEKAYTYPIPYAWTADFKLRRFGFHGLNYAWCSTKASQLLGPEKRKLVICHLGHGASACAVSDGKSVYTTMGLTPLEGLMMGTRSGTIDAGIIFHLARTQKLSIEEIEKALLKDSGLLGVSGKSADMREVITLAQAGDDRANLAIEIYCLRVQQAIGALSTTMGGVDAVIFTAGVGENAALIREKVIAPLGFLGLEIDTALNNACQPDCDISKANSKSRVLVLAAREELQMLHEIESLLNQ